MKQSFSMKGNAYTNEKTDNVCAGGLPLLQTGFCNTGTVVHTESLIS